MRVLLIEDSKRLQESIARGLRKTGFAVDVVGDGKQGLIFAQTTDYDVIVLDLMLPLVDGLSVLKQLRDKGKQTHILILSAKDTVDDRVRGLNTGADDYLVKPFAFDELVARIEALARRQQGTKSALIHVGDLVIDTAARRVMRDGLDVALSRREYAILEYLAHRKGRPVSRMELEEHVYDDRTRIMSNAIDSAVCTLRAKLHALNIRSLLRTRRGVGYLLDDAPRCGTAVT